MKGTYPRGQVLLITVLVLSVAVTIALSLISRSVSDVSMSRNLEESARAFSAAEAGIEEALRANTLESKIVPYGGTGGYQSSVAVIGNNSTGVYTLPAISVGQADTVWLVAHKDSNELVFPPPYYYPNSAIDICWSHATPVPALEVAIYYYNSALSTYSVTRRAYDPDSASRPQDQPPNKFLPVTNSNNISSGCGGMNNVYRQTVDISTILGIPVFMRIRPYYANATVSIAPLDGDSLPTQGFEVSSVGCTQITPDGCSEGGVMRKIVVRRQYPGAATIFDYSLYSQGALEH